MDSSKEEEDGGEHHSKKHHGKHHGHHSSKHHSSSSSSKEKEEERKESNELFNQLDEDQSDSVSLQEMEKFVASNSKLWAFLSVNFGRPVEECQEVATRVAMELATGREGKKALKKSISRSQFHRFNKNYIQDPAGAREFFQRTIFETFDENHDSLLDEDEMEKLCDALYGASFYLEDSQKDQMKGGILQGTLRLPPREKFMEMLREDMDINKDGKLEIREVVMFLKKLRKKTVREGREEGIHKEDREHAETLALAKAEAEAKMKHSREVEAKEEEKNKTEDDWFLNCVYCEWVSGLFNGK